MKISLLFKNHNVCLLQKTCGENEKHLPNKALYPVEEMATVFYLIYALSDFLMPL